MQVTWLGYMCTTGMQAMEYRITDAYLDPPGQTERFYTEQLMRMESAAAFQPAADSPPVSAPPARAAGHVCFGSVNNYLKMGDEVIALWGAILHAVPDSRLLLVAQGGEEPAICSEIKERFARLSGQASVAERIDVSGRQPLQGFLRLFERIDIALDPFPYSGGTTSLHTLWMGVPIVTLEGDSELSRSTSGMIKACGLPELVAASTAEYMDIAISLARNVARMAELRQLLRPRLAASALGHAEQVTRGLETLYRTMWLAFIAKRQQ